MAYINVDFSDDRVAGRYHTGPIVIVPGESSQIYPLYDLHDTKCEKPLDNLVLTRPGEYKTVLHVFAKQDIDIFQTLEFSVIYAPSASSVLNGTAWRESKISKDRQFWENSPYWCRMIQHFYNSGTAPIKISLDMNTIGTEVVECVEVCIEFHYLS